VSLHPDRPWVLVRKGAAPLRFRTLEEARRFYDGLRFNGAANADALVVGPERETWRCGRWKGSAWRCERAAATAPAWWWLDS